jgi:hypothetical protein
MGPLASIVDKELRKKAEESSFLCFVDSQGRYADFHALRKTFITNLSKSGVSPKMAQSLARHSDINLTMNVYIDVATRESRAGIVTLKSAVGPPNIALQCLSFFGFLRLMRIKCHSGRTSLNSTATMEVADDERTFRNSRSHRISSVPNRRQVKRFGHRDPPSDKNRHNRLNWLPGLGRKTCFRHVVDALASLLD